MLILAVDTSTSSGSLAVLRDHRLVGVIGVTCDGPYSSRLFRHLDLLLSDLDLAQKDFDLYAVVAGPGSFTGLRIGLTAIKGWAEVFSKPVVPVSGLEMMASACESPQRYVAPFYDARRAQIFGALFEWQDSLLTRRGDDMVLSPSEFLTYVGLETRGQPVSFVSATPSVLDSALARSPYLDSTVQQVSPFLAPSAGLAALVRALAGKVTDALHLEANYVRRSDAELLWKPR